MSAASSMSWRRNGFNDNGTETTVSAGDTTFCMDGEEHNLLNNGTENLEFIALILFSK